MTITLQPVQSDDAAALLSLMKSVICSLKLNPKLQSDIIDNVTENMVFALANPDSCAHIKATKDGKIFGVILVKNHWNLCSLFVAPTFQKQGIGRALVEAAIDECAPKSPKSALWINAATGAIPFYRRLGFIEHSVQQSLSSDFLAMRLDL